MRYAGSRNKATESYVSHWTNRSNKTDVIKSVLSVVSVLWQCPNALSTALRNNIVYRVRALDAHELLVEAVVEIAQVVRVEAELVKHGGVETAHV